MNTRPKPKSVDRYARFGTIAVEKGFISVDSLFKAMKVQLDENLKGLPHRQIGTILFDMKLLTGAQIDEVMRDLLRARNSA